MHAHQICLLVCLCSASVLSAPLDVSHGIVPLLHGARSVETTTDLEVYAPRSVTADTTDVSLVVKRDRAAWVGTGTAALGVIALTTCSGSFVFPVIGPAVCALSLAGLLFTAVGSFLHGLYGMDPKLKREFEMYPRASLPGPADDITWFHSRGDHPVHRSTILANYAEGGPPLLIGETHGNSTAGSRLWYSHSTQQSWDGGSGTIRRIMHTPKHVEFDMNGRLVRRQDDTESGSDEGLTGAYVFNEGDATTAYDAQTDSSFSDDIVNEMAQQNGDSETGKFSEAGVYCMNIDSDTRPTPLGTTGYLWYYEDPSQYQADQESSYMSMCAGEV